jgi:hypothetical protein
MTGLLVPVALLWLAFGPNDEIPPAQPVLSALAIPVLMAGLAGAPVGARNPWVKDTYTIGASTATLPMSIGEMMGAKLRAAALSTLAAWAIVVLAVPSAVILTGNLETAVGWWRQARQEIPLLQIVAGLLASAILLVGYTWKRLVDSQLFALTGRKWVIESAVSGGIILLVGFGLGGLWIFKQPQIREQLLPLVPWLLGLLIACRLSLAGLALRAGLRRRVLEPRTAVRWVIAWVCVTLTLFGLLAYAVPAERVPVYTLAFAVLFAMPMARLTAAPLALAWNRHR